MMLSHSFVNEGYEVLSVAAADIPASHRGTMDAATLKAELQKPGRSQSALARFMKLDAASVNRMCGGGPGRKISVDEAELITAYLAGTARGGAAQPKTPMERLTSAPALQFLPIRFRVQAGAWLQADVYATQDYGDGPIPMDPRIAPQSQWLEEVVGESMNRVIQPGMLVHVIDAIHLEYSPRDRDVVVVERTRFQGAEIERSLKRVHINGGGIELRGDSTIAEFNEPISTNGDNDDIEVRIAGWVRHAIVRL